MWTSPLVHNNYFSNREAELKGVALITLHWNNYSPLLQSVFSLQIAACDLAYRFSSDKNCKYNYFFWLVTIFLKFSPDNSSTLKHVLYVRKCYNHDMFWLICAPSQQKCLYDILSVLLLTLITAWRQRSTLSRTFDVIDLKENISVSYSPNETKYTWESEQTKYQCIVEIKHVIFTCEDTMLLHESSPGISLAFI